MASADQKGFPRTVFIVPDGNRRRARRLGFPTAEGHRMGFETFKKIFDAAWEYDITHLVFWAISFDNLERRTKAEIQFLYLLLHDAILEVEKKIVNDPRGIQFRAIGEWRTQLPEGLADDIRRLERKTASKDQRIFALLLAYDGVREMRTAISRLSIRDPRETDFPSKGLLHSYLWSSSIPNIDLYIRTGCEGDPHLSGGALMLQMANAQLAFTETLWPDFTIKEFDRIMMDYKKRERRLGE